MEPPRLSPRLLIEVYKDSRIAGVGDLTLDPNSRATGAVKMAFIGAPALNWRHRSLTGDSTSLNDEFSESLERLMPGGIEIKVASIDTLEDHEQPLAVTFTVKGRLAPLPASVSFFQRISSK